MRVRREGKKKRMCSCLPVKRYTWLEQYPESSDQLVYSHTCRFVMKVLVCTYTCHVVMFSYLCQSFPHYFDPVAVIATYALLFCCWDVV